METEEIKISEKDFVTLILKEENIEVLVKYPKRSTLIKRLEVFKKIETLMRKI